MGPDLSAEAAAAQPWAGAIAHFRQHQTRRRGHAGRPGGSDAGLMFGWPVHVTTASHFSFLDSVRPAWRAGRIFTIAASCDRIALCRTAEPTSDSWCPTV